MSFVKRRRRDRALAVDMTPMIDIVFQLLIFFLTTARLADLSRTRLDLPEEPGEQRRSSEAAGLIVNVAADGAIVIGQETVTMDDLERIAADVLRRAADGTAPQPLVRADRNGSAAVLNEVLRRLQRSGFTAVRIGTAPVSLLGMVNSVIGAGLGAGAAPSAPEGAS